MNDLENDILSLMSDTVMHADHEGEVDDESLEMLHTLIEVYFKERVNGQEVH